MERQVASWMTVTADAPAQLVLSVAVADEYGSSAVPVVRQAGRELMAAPVSDQHGATLHVVDVDAGRATISYQTTVFGTAAADPVTDIDRIRYRRPSRYCESDTLAPIARAQFGGLTGRDLLDGVSSWVGSQLLYVPGSSLPTDGAVNTLLARRGVCRDYAHLVVALLRALDVPARLVSVYAPGLSPMDFHAVAEAAIDDEWSAVDATALAPRQSLVRIATGRDASDTAFLTSFGGRVTLDTLEVAAVVDALPMDDVRDRVRIS